MKITFIKDFYEDAGVANGFVLFKGEGDLHSDSGTMPLGIIPLSETPVMRIEDGELSIATKEGEYFIPMGNLEVKDTSEFSGWNSTQDGFKEAMKDIIMWTKPIQETT